MQIRVLLGGCVDSVFTSDLQQLVRERLIAFLRRTLEWLPRLRSEETGGKP